MLAHGIKGNIANDNQFVTILRGVESHLRFGINSQTGEGLLVKIGNPLRRVDQTFAGEILAYPIQNQADPLDNFLLIDRFAEPLRGPTRTDRLYFR